MSIKSIIVVLLCLLLAACGSHDSKKVAFLYPSATRIRFVKEGNFIVERLKQLGADAVMVEGEDNEALQLERGMKLVDEGIDLLIIAPVNGNTIAPLVRYAKDKGIPVIAFNRLISNVDYDLFLTGDNSDIANILCSKALAMKPSGNYAIMAGDRFDRNGVELKHAIDSLLKPHIEKGNVKIVYESHIEGWNRQNAEFELNQTINSWGTNIDAVIACSDPMAQGCISVLKKFDLAGKVVVTGQDAELDNVKSIINGEQHVTVYHPHKVLGYKVAELALAILKGEKPKKLANASTYNGSSTIPTFKVKSVAITKDNYVKELVATGEYKISDF